MFQRPVRSVNVHRTSSTDCLRQNTGPSRAVSGSVGTMYTVLITLSWNTVIAAPHGQAGAPCVSLVSTDKNRSYPYESLGELCGADIMTVRKGTAADSCCSQTQTHVDGSVGYTTHAIPSTCPFRSIRTLGCSGFLSS